ncbi:TatD family hydrolase [Agrilutibacter solisilvae]|uniref:TatD family hydrolase n=1 Tax=Agrilutibacter solisilvae TaxID=2763317 RepID=A0A974XYM4_9GAMM|nr:TatD family hydrolase [Lysobacter solisilvae]QSX78192.1 TatD family hydrolase [Lysobacter solisilvae]
MDLVDSHSHFDQAEFDADREAALERAHAAGVARQVVPAVDAAGWPKLRAVCASASGLHPAYGLHPICLANHRPEHLDQLRTWLRHEQSSMRPPVAVGECGLDFFLDTLDRQAQQFYFDAQLRIAREFDLPVIVHARRSVDAVIGSIRRIGGLRGVVHSFSGSPEQARQLWSLGFLIGLGGPVTYERANRLRRLAASMPLEQLLLETDSPDQPNAGHRGERNEPAHLREVLATIAQLRGVDETKVAEATTANALRLFRL